MRYRSLFQSQRSVINFVCYLLIRYEIVRQFNGIFAILQQLMTVSKRKKIVTNGIKISERRKNKSSKKCCAYLNDETTEPNCA